MLAVSSANGSTSAVGAGSAYQSSTSSEATTKAFVDYYNRHGGFAGRRLDPVTYTINASDSNYEASLSAACAKFTQDNHVSAVLTQLGLLYSGNYQSCLAKAGAINIEASLGAADQTDMEKFPLYYNVEGPSTDRRLSVLLKGGVSAGLITRKNSVGVIVENCPMNTRAYTRTFQPLAQQLGLKVTRYDVSCLRGFSDAAGFLSQTQAAVLKFRSAGVDLVTFDTAWEALATLGFENQANSQDYHPTYVGTSASNVVAASEQYSTTQAARFHAVGWLPFTDVTTIPQSAAVKECAAIAKTGGITPKNAQDWGVILLVCEQMRVFREAVVAANGHTDRGALQAGLAKVRSVPGSPMQLGGFSFSAQGRDSGRQYAIASLVGSCGCFRYTTALRPFPS